MDPVRNPFQPRPWPESPRRRAIFVVLATIAWVTLAAHLFTTLLARLP